MKRVSNALNDGCLPSVCLVSTYPPTKCGLATFTRSLRDALVTGRSGQDSPSVLRVPATTDAGPHAAPGVVGHLLPDRPASVAHAARLLGTFDITIVQHEFGIFGPNDGIAVLDLLAQLESPAIVVLHTVPLTPTFRQKRIVEGIARRAAAVVVMSRAAGITLRRKYRINGASIHVVPHGAHAYAGPPRPADSPPRILTWGLIGPGKGIECGVRALALLKHLEPAPVYQVCGETHPNVLAHQGEAYRTAIETLAASLGVSKQLDMRSEYLPDARLAELVSSCDIVLLPYDSREQATSGVLIDAVAAGKPVVATAFPHAVELLETGAGIVVPHEDPAAMASALERLLTDRDSYDAAAEAARTAARSLSWASVAKRYETLAREVISVSEMEVA